MQGFKMEIIHGLDHVDPDDDNVDVRVILDDGRRFMPTFFTLANVQRLMDKYALEGGNANGLYFHAADAVMIRRLTDEAIHAAVKDMVTTGGIADACRQLEDCNDDQESS